MKDETQAKNDAPDLLYILYKDVVVFDHFRNEMIIIELLADGEEDDLDVLERDINNRQIRVYDFHPVGDYTSTLTDEEHKANIRKGIKHCLRGDVFQIVLSRRFIQKYEGDDFKLYRALRSINPSPYLFYFDFGGFRIFGSSPETHCRIEKKGDSYHAYIDPIAGTTKRTGNTEQDRQNAEYLRTDPKENAEHVMLVDLARNDLSRNCHGVKVDFYKDMGTGDVIKSMERHGIDMIEVGIPFSDPMADGPVIQNAATKALRNGMSLCLLFSQLKAIKDEVKMPLVLMGYLNVVLQYGIEEFCKSCVECGVSGAISYILVVA